MEIKLKKEKKINYIELCVCFIIMFIIILILFTVDIEIDIKFTKFIIAVFSIILTIGAVYHLTHLKYETWLKVNNDGIKYIKNKLETLYSFEELLVKKENRKYFKSISYGSPYCRRLGIRTEYDFFKDGQYLFTLDETNHKEVIDFLKDKIKIDDGFINGEKIIELKPKIGDIASYIGAILITILGIIGFILISNILKEDFKIMFVVLGIAVILELYYMIREIKQFNQKVCWIKDKGFYVEKKGIKNFYKFNEIDRGETECYFVQETVDHTIRLYKNNENILELTNSSQGFYDFLEELKIRKIIE